MGKDTEQPCALLKGVRTVGFPANRPRRLRRTGPLRTMARETRLSASDLVYPLFAAAADHVDEPLPHIPGARRLSGDPLVAEAAEIRDLGIPAVLIFGIPRDEDKDAAATACVRRGRTNATGRTGHQGVGPRPGGCHRPLPVRVHLPRSLRPGAGRRDRQRRDAGMYRSDRGVACRGRRGLCRAVGDDGRRRPDDSPVAGRCGLTPSPPRCRTRRSSHPVSTVRSTSHALDARGESACDAPTRRCQWRRGVARDRDRPGRRRRHRDRETGSLVAGHYRPGLRDVPDSDCGVQRLGELRDLLVRSGRRIPTGSTVATEALTCIKRAGADIIITYFAKDAARWLRP